MKIDCISIKEEVIQKTKAEVNQTQENGGIISLAIIQVGDDPRSNSYIENKLTSCDKAGIVTHLYKLSEDILEEHLIEVVQTLNENPDITGILIQSPLPSHINENKVMQTISPLKDVDCFTYENVCKMLNGESEILPCTPKGIIEILKHFYAKFNLPNGDLRKIKRDVLIIGKGKTIGRYLVPILNNLGFTCTQIHSNSWYSVEYYINGIRPDIIISCVGKDGLFSKDNLKMSYVYVPELIIDCGISFKGKQLRGDFLREDYPWLEENLIHYTPCKGGVGQTTVASVLTNLLELYRLQNKLK